MGKSETKKADSRLFPVIQRHHISYEPEVVVYITKAEHLVLSKISWYTKKIISDGFLTALADIIIDNNRRCVDLKPEYERRVAAKKEIKNGRNKRKN